MRRLAPALLGLLAACQQGGPVAPTDTTVAHATGPTSTEMAKTLAGRTPGVSTASATDPKAASAPSEVTLAPAAIDPNRKREYVDVFVDMNNPAGMKALVPYLMKMEEWHIEKSVQVSPTQKHWRFWRFVRTDGKSLPEVDPLLPRR